MTFAPEEITSMAEKMAICFSADSFEFTNDGLLEFTTLVAEKAAAKEREACRMAARNAVLRLIPEHRASGDMLDHAIYSAIRARGQS